MIKQFSYIFEILLFTAIVLTVGYVNGNLAYIGVQFHPFYFVILLIASRYGYTKCLFTGIFMGAIYLLFYFVRLGDIDLTNFWTNCYQPIAFLAFAMFVGLLVEVDKKKISALIGSITNLNETLRSKQHEIDQVVSLNVNLSDQLTVTDKTFNIVFRETREFYNHDIMSIYEAAYGVLCKIIKATKAFVFYLDGKEFKLAYPTEELEDSKKFLVQNETRIEDVRRSHEFMRLDSNIDHDPSGRVPLLIGPIIHRDTDALYGIVVIEEMDFLIYNENTYLTFKNLCTWLGDVFYFRSSIQQSSIVSPLKTDYDFDFLIEYGAPREKIRGVVELFLSDGDHLAVPAIADKIG